MLLLSLLLLLLFLFLKKKIIKLDLFLFDFVCQYETYDALLSSHMLEFIKAIEKNEQNIVDFIVASGFEKVFFFLLKYLGHVVIN